MLFLGHSTFFVLDFTAFKHGGSVAHVGITEGSRNTMAGYSTQGSHWIRDRLLQDRGGKIGGVLIEVYTPHKVGLGWTGQKGGSKSVYKYKKHLWELPTVL